MNFKSKRDIPVSRYTYLSKYRAFDPMRINAKFRKFHIDCCSYYDEGYLSQIQINKWTSVIKTTEAKESKESRSHSKRI